MVSIILSKWINKLKAESAEDYYIIYAKPAIDNYGKVYYISNNIIGRNSYPY